MKIVVTGGAGFIGSHFVRLLLREHPDDVVVNFDKLTYAGNLDNLRDVEGEPRYSFVEGDICCWRRRDGTVPLATCRSRPTRSTDRPIRARSPRTTP